MSDTPQVLYNLQYSVERIGLLFSHKAIQRSRSVHHKAAPGKQSPTSTLPHCDDNDLTLRCQTA